MEQQQRTPLFENPRFVGKIRQVLSLSTLKKKYIDKMTKPENMKLYAQAFTHSSVEEVNYEWLEIMGDATLNKCIVWYINQRFPQLQNAGGVKVIARLKINLVSKHHFSDIAEKLGFAEFIQVNEEAMMNQANSVKNKPINPRSLLEDVLEAFFGATEMLIDRIVSVGAGYGVCFHLLKNIMDPIPISLKYEDLYDPITRLKETFDIFRTQLWGQVRYEPFRTENISSVNIFQFDPSTGRKTFLVTSSGTTLDEAKQKAALLAIDLLSKRGFKRPVPEYYATL